MKFRLLVHVVIYFQIYRGLTLLNRIQFYVGNFLFSELVLQAVAESVVAPENLGGCYLRTSEKSGIL